MSQITVNDPQLTPVVKVMNALVDPQTARKLAYTTGLDRATVDRTLRYLKRRGFVCHEGAWCLTAFGEVVVAANAEKSA